MTIQPHTGDAETIVSRQFEFVCMADLAGHQQSRADLAPARLNANTLEMLFERFKPSCVVWASFEGVDDLKLDVAINGVRDFRPKALNQNVSMLATIAQVRKLVEEASEQSPVDTSQFQGADIDWLKALANQTADEGFVDLLSMVDIGDDENEGLYLKYLKQFFATASYVGSDRSRVAADLKTVQQHIVEAIQKDTLFRQLEATWRGLAAIMNTFGEHAKLSVIDCAQDDLCDAYFLNYLKPESGDPLPLDFAFTTYELDHKGPSLHILHHLGRMSMNLGVPFVFNASPQVMGAKTYTQLSHTRDISGKFSSPAHTKWRALRDEPGAEWLFGVLNPWRLDEGDDNRKVWGAPALFVASLFARRLKTGKWPSEMLGASGIWDISSETAATIDDAQAIDYAYEGLGVLGHKHLGIALMGMNMLADVKLTGPESLEAANFVEYTLPYRFFVGCASRYFLDHYLPSNDTNAFARYLGVENPEAFTFEEEEGQVICRFQAPFTIYSSQADVVIGAQRT